MTITTPPHVVTDDTTDGTTTGTNINGNNETNDDGFDGDYPRFESDASTNNVEPAAPQSSLALSSTEDAAKKVDATGTNNQSQNDEEIGGSVPPSLKSTENGEKHPDVFYCSLSKKVMKNPVVSPDGNSYERSAFLEHHPETSPDSLYENRALLSVIERTTERAAPRVADGSLLAGALAYVGLRRDDDEDDGDLPSAYYCPITFNLMHEPTVDADGNTYERAAIVAWIRRKGASPVTRRPARVEELYPNRAVAALLEVERARSGPDLHPDLKRWKEEPPPRPDDFPMGDEEAGGDGDVGAATNADADEDEESPADQRYRRHRSVWSVCGFVLAVFTVAYFFYGKATYVLQVFCVVSLSYACCQNFGGANLLRSDAFERDEDGRGRPQRRGRGRGRVRERVVGPMRHPIRRS